MQSPRQPALHRSDLPVVAGLVGAVAGLVTQSTPLSVGAISVGLGGHWLVIRRQYGRNQEFQQGILTGQGNFEHSLGQLREQVSHLESQLGGLGQQQQNLSHHLTTQENITTQIRQQLGQHLKQLQAKQTNLENQFTGLGQELRLHQQNLGNLETRLTTQNNTTQEQLSELQTSFEARLTTVEARFNQAWAQQRELELTQQLSETINTVESNLSSLTSEVELIRQYLNNSHENRLETISIQEARDQIIKICNHFDLLLKWLKREYIMAKNVEESIIQSTFTIKNEEDVQRLLNVLLHIFYNDVVREVYVPYFGGKNSIIDFLLYKSRIGIEVKTTLKSSSNSNDNTSPQSNSIGTLPDPADKTPPRQQDIVDKDIAKQLFEDIGRYRTLCEMKLLIFFVYDPDRLIAHPHKLKQDLDGNWGKFDVITIICPH